MLFNYLKLASISLPYAGSLLSAYSCPHDQASKKWYKSLRRPWYCPTDETVTLVWPCLYGMMGYASYLVLEKLGDFETAMPYLVPYATQLGLNFIWPPIFYGTQNLLLATLCAGALTIASYTAQIEFTNVDKAAGQLMFPITLWCAYSTIVTAQMWKLNCFSEDID